MELNSFLKLLNRQKFILIVIPLITVIITYFLVRQLPSVYSSKARIATGLADQSEQVLSAVSFLEDSKIDQEFGNILQVMQLNKMYEQVSYKLILHDMLNPDSAFRKPSKLMKDLNPDAKRHAIDVYTKLYAESEPLVLGDKDQNGLHQVLISMGYDEESLKRKMSIYRVNKSDFIDIDFESENPNLCTFVVNTLCAEFIHFYTSVVKNGQQHSVTFLDSLKKDKENALNMTMEQLKQYKIQNRILNLDEQSKVLYTQVADMETKVELAKKDVEAYGGIIKNIDSKFDPSDRQFIESTTRRVNQDIVATTNQIKSLTDLYIRNDYDPRYKAKIDSLRNVVNGQINEAADKYATNPLATKENLVIQKINAQVALDLAKYSINSLQQEIARLNRVINSLVPHEAQIQSFEQKIDVASKEYLEALNKFNQTSLTSNQTVRIRQIEYGMPGPAAPSKKMLLVILSGVISFTFCLLVLFILFYIDNNIKTATALANQTGRPVLGVLPFIGTEVLDLKKMWNGEYDATRSDEYKNMIRSIRFEISEQMGNDKILVVTSIKPEEGKTFTALNIAYAYSRIGKKVLLIDGNFDDPVLSQTINTSYSVEDYLNGKTTPEQLRTDTHLTILSNRGGDISLFETVNQDVASERLRLLETIFDIILIDAPALKELSKSREWIAVADRVVAVFEVDQSLSGAKQQHVDYLQSLGAGY
jgi:succinoglycan biosynthesis transport protein ExoP